MVLPELVGVGDSNEGKASYWIRAAYALWYRMRLNRLKCTY